VFTDDAGKEIQRFIWNGQCDGKHSPIQGENLPGAASLSWRFVAPGASEMELRADSGYSHSETCRMAPDGRKHTCTGTATLPDGSKHDLVYVFDRR
jgi:hypothetical protein